MYGDVQTSEIQANILMTRLHVLWSDNLKVAWCRNIREKHKGKLFEWQIRVVILSLYTFVKGLHFRIKNNKY